MTLRLLVAALVVACATAAQGQAPMKPKVIDEADFGLGKGSVFDTATPKAYTFEGPGAGKLIPPPVATPVMIPHPIDPYLPLTIEKNACLGCHDLAPPAARKVAKGTARPLPASHYVLREGKRTLSGAQFNCTACHAPQAGVAPLVTNAASPTR